jgi:hypothetical protein
MAAPREDRYRGAVADGRATDAGHAAINARRRMRTTGTLPATVSGLLARLLRQAAASASKRVDAAATRVRSSTACISFPFSFPRAHKTVKAAVCSASGTPGDRCG